MGLYVHLVTMTDQGAAKIKEQSSGYGEYADFVKSIDGKVVSAVACLGEYDYLVIADYPDEQSAMRASAFIAQQGMVRAQTLPAVSVEEFFRAIG